METTTAQPEKPAPLRYEVRAPARPEHNGVGVGGYYWTTTPATAVEVIDGETDGPHEAGLRRLSRKTWGVIMLAADRARLFVSAPQGERAVVDQAMIIRLTADLSVANAKIADLSRDLEIARATIGPLREQSTADASTVALAREEASEMRQRAAEAVRIADGATREQARSEEKAALLAARVEELEKQIAGRKAR
jgi:hypothetical protein